MSSYADPKFSIAASSITFPDGTYINQGGLYDLKFNGDSSSYFRFQCFATEFWNASSELIVSFYRYPGGPGAFGLYNGTTLALVGQGQTTVGAAGAASSLPATPSKYLPISDGTTTYVVPAYLAS